MLADAYARPEWFPYCKSELSPHAVHGLRFGVVCSSVYLDWEYRKHNLIAEIVAQDADIICLQEVDRFAALCFSHGSSLPAGGADMEISSYLS